MQQNTRQASTVHLSLSDDGDSGLGSRGNDWRSGRARGGKTRLLVLGSYPPRACGIATFTKDVVDSIVAHAATECDVIAIDEPGSEIRAYGPAVVARLKRDDRSSNIEATAFINAHPASVLLVQHEYGLFGGEDGEAFLDLIATVRKPVIIALHTIVTAPSAHHRAVTQRICARATLIVVLSQTGKDILQREYDLNAKAIRVIPHGVPDVPFTSTAFAKQRLALSNRKIISTFGLLSRDKGLEDAIGAMRTIAAEHPSALYLILGQTHPLVRQHEGESYRDDLETLVTTYGLQHNVAFVDRYLSFEDLIAYLAATDIYLTPYLNADQIVSGTLAYALGCGKAIVSTPYLYAREVLAHDRGLLCQFRDPASIARSVLSLLDHTRRRHAMEQRAYRYGHRMRWANVAMSYSPLFRDAINNNALKMSGRLRASTMSLRMGLQKTLAEGASP